MSSRDVLASSECVSPRPPGRPQKQYSKLTVKLDSELSECRSERERPDDVDEEAHGEGYGSEEEEKEGNHSRSAQAS